MEGKTENLSQSYIFSMNGCDKNLKKNYAIHGWYSLMY